MVTGNDPGGAQWTCFLVLSHLYSIVTFSMGAEWACAQRHAVLRWDAAVWPCYTNCRQHFVLFACGSGTTLASCSSWTFKAELPLTICFQVSETEFYSSAKAGLCFTWGPGWSQICYHLLASDPQLLELQVWATMRNFSYNFLFFLIIILPLRFIFTFI